MIIKQWNIRVNNYICSCALLFDNVHIDQFVNGVANESKVEYTTLTSSVKNQIAKYAELIANGSIKGPVCHFFRSPITGKIGASKPLLQELQKHNIKYILH